MEEGYNTVEEFAHRNAVYSRIHEGRLKAEDIGGGKSRPTWRIPKGAVIQPKPVFPKIGKHGGRGKTYLERLEEMAG